MKSTTAQQFGSLGKSFGAPAAAAAVIGAALLASDTSDTSETAWSPAAACLLPDVLPVAGTLLSYGGSRQLAAGGTVTHSGALSIGANALTCGAITASDQINANANIVFAASSVSMSSGEIQRNGSTNNQGVVLRETSTGAALVVIPNNALIYANSGLKIYTNTSADGPLQCGAITASGNVTTAGDLVLASGSTGIRLVYNSSGVGTIYNYAGTDFGRLNLGGTTASFPAIKRSSAAIALRLADDSADAALTCGAITASGYITSNSTAPGFELKSSGTRVGFIYYGAAENRLYSDTNAPWVVESNAGFKVRNLANTADAALTCGAITASGAVQETPTQSALDPTTTNIPSGKRQGWYNSTLSEFRDWVNIGGTLLKSAAYT